MQQSLAAFFNEGQASCLKLLQGSLVNIVDQRAQPTVSEHQRERNADVARSTDDSNIIFGFQACKKMAFLACYFKAKSAGPYFTTTIMSAARLRAWSNSALAINSGSFARGTRIRSTSGSGT